MDVRANLRNHTKQSAQWVAKQFKKYKPYITMAFAALVIYLIYTAVKDTDWPKVWEALENSSPKYITFATATALLSYAAYASYDLFSSRLLKIDVPRLPSWLIAWVSYSANLNLGAMVGSLALRYKLYSEINLNARETSKIIGVSVTTNWCCYALLIAVVGFLNVDMIAQLTKLPENMLRACLLLAATAFVVCLVLPSNAFSRKIGLAKKLEDLGISNTFKFYPGMLIGFLHWGFMAVTMYFAFEQEVSFLTIYTCVLLSCIAGAVAHVPGGLGVIEAVFLTLLGGEVENHVILANLFVYRAAFYIFPAVLTLIFYLSTRYIVRQEKFHAQTG